jgi:hypothetical protein
LQQREREREELARVASIAEFDTAFPIRTRDNHPRYDGLPLETRRRSENAIEAIRREEAERQRVCW